MNLFLDDVRQPGECTGYMCLRIGNDGSKYERLEWIIVRNYKQFVNYIDKNGLPDLISFDHDLAEIHYNPRTWTESFKYHEETGLDCAKWLVNYCIDNELKLPDYLVHSMNPVGTENIESLLKNYKKHESNNSRR